MIQQFARVFLTKSTFCLLLHGMLFLTLATASCSTGISCSMRLDSEVAKVAEHFSERNVLKSEKKENVTNSPQNTTQDDRNILTEDAIKGIS